MLTNKSLCVVLELCQSYELWHWIICTPVVLALSYLLSLLCQLILPIHFTFRQHFTSSKSGIISCTSRCYQGSRIIGKDKTKTEKWENKPLTQRMLLLHPSAVPHLSRLQPLLGSASWIEGGQWICSMWNQWKWTQPCPQVLQEQAEWHEAILLHFKAPDQLERISSECFSSWNRRRHWDITLRCMQPYLGEQEEEQLLQVAKWDKKFSAVYVIHCINILKSSWKGRGE